MKWVQPFFWGLIVVFYFHLNIVICIFSCPIFADN